MRAAIFDYGAGNLHSLTKVVAGAGVSVSIESDPERAAAADLLILPGVGNFGAAAERLAPARDLVRERIAGGLPTLGVCLGMQLLFEHSEEAAGAGLGVFAGDVTRIDAERLPHIGWNTIDDARDGLFDRAPLARVYYANSYVCRATDPADVTAWTTYGRDRFPAAVRRGRAVGVQFHPEKSSTAGVAFVRAFLQEAAR